MTAVPTGPGYPPAPQPGPNPAAPPAPAAASASAARPNLARHLQLLERGWPWVLMTLVAGGAHQRGHFYAESRRHRGGKRTR